MARQPLQVIFTHSALRDLEEIVDYWATRDEPERGEKYARGLPAKAIAELSNPHTAAAGKHLQKTAWPEVQELPVFQRAYRILYLRREAEGTVEVLRFWHSHRDGPFLGGA